MKMVKLPRWFRACIAYGVCILLCIDAFVINIFSSIWVNWTLLLIQHYVVFLTIDDDEDDEEETAEQEEMEFEKPIPTI